MSRAYSAASAGLDATAKDQLKADLISWLINRMGCASNEQCIADRYRSYIGSLKEKGAKPTLRPSGRGYVGGMVEEFRTYAYNVPLNLPADRLREARVEADHQFKRRLALAGIKPEKFIDPKDYDFILGVATTSSLIKDTPRALWNELTSGRGTQVMADQYEALRGRSFDVLDCHSNGAMICLGAIMNGDVRAGLVRLYGPQVTKIGLRQWQMMLQSGNIQRLEIHFVRRDPVPTISFGGSSWEDLVTVLDSEALGVLLSSEVPSAKIIPQSCDLGGPYLYSIDCHDMKFYQTNR